VKAETVELDRPLGLWLDGERVGDARTLAFRCLPDALRILV
jgi:diacylglycerol kinase family enzyme